MSLLTPVDISPKHFTEAVLIQISTVCHIVKSPYQFELKPNLGWCWHFRELCVALCSKVEKKKRKVEFWMSLRSSPSLPLSLSERMLGDSVEPTWEKEEKEKKRKKQPRLPQGEETTYINVFLCVIIRVLWRWGHASVQDIISLCVW